MPSMIFLGSERKVRDKLNARKLDAVAKNKWKSITQYEHCCKTGEIKLLKSYW